MSLSYLCHLRQVSIFGLMFVCALPKQTLGLRVNFQTYSYPKDTLQNQHFYVALCLLAAVSSHDSWGIYDVAPELRLKLVYCFAAFWKPEWSRWMTRVDDMSLTCICFCFSIYRLMLWFSRSFMRWCAGAIRQRHINWCFIAQLYCLNFQTV